MAMELKLLKTEIAVQRRNYKAHPHHETVVVDAFLDWYDDRTEEQKLIVDRYLKWIQEDRQMRNRNVRFGMISAIEVLAVGMAVREGWIKPRRMG